MSGIIGQGSKSGVIGAKDSISNISDIEYGKLTSPLLLDTTPFDFTASGADDFSTYIKIGNWVTISYNGYTGTAHTQSGSICKFSLPFSFGTGQEMSCWGRFYDGSYKEGFAHLAGVVGSISADGSNLPLTSGELLVYYLTLTYNTETVTAL